MTDSQAQRMAAVQTSKTGRMRRKTREEKARETYLRILEAAAQVVGEDGYADSSISKITQLAGIAQGTFYNYFETRQQVFDALLPYMGEQMVDYIRTAVPPEVQGAARETARLRAFFTYLNEHPVFYRILYEAEVFAPAAHAKHFQILVDGYRGALERAVARGEIEGYDAEELEAIIYILLSARAYLAMRYVRRAEDGRGTVPEHVISAYEKLMTRGLYGKPDA